MFSFQVSVDGTTRDAWLYVPTQYTGNAALPVIFNWHGAGSTGLQQLALTYFNQLADRDHLGDALEPNLQPLIPLLTTFYFGTNHTLPR